MQRASLSITLSSSDLAGIRKQAAHKHCSMNRYVLGSVRKQVPFDDRLYQAGRQMGVAAALHTPWHHPVTGRRAALHLSCSELEAIRIKRAAHRRGTSVSEYVVGCLKGSWGFPEPPDANQRCA
jgi:predicted DNA binding CopG/RHH family protein